MKITKQPMSGKIYERNVKTIYPYAWEQLDLFKERYDKRMNRIEQIIQQSGLNPSHETINLAHSLIREALTKVTNYRDALKVLEHFGMDNSHNPVASPTAKFNMDINPNLSQEELDELEEEMREWNKSFKL
jgi:hypothetical protein